MITYLRWMGAPGPTLRWIGSLRPLPVPVPIPTLAGVIGPVGPDGPAGAGTGVDFVQTSASSEWIVNHNLGAAPVVSIRSPGGVEVEAHVVHQSNNQFRVYFPSPQAGSARYY